MKSLRILPLLAFFAASFLNAQDDYQLRKAVECNPRQGLPNFLAKVAEGKSLKVAYLGGSITAANGWRVQSREWFQKEYPKAKFEEIHAAIGGTGSDLGVFRLERDVLRHHPDLLFVEFAVNDGGASPVQIHKAMEGIVRQTWVADPTIDICYVYTLKLDFLEDLHAGKMPRAASAMEELADHYAIPSIHFGVEVAKLVKEGKLVFKAPKPDNIREAKPMVFSSDGVHPHSETGHVLYTESIARSWPAITEASGKPAPHKTIKPLRADNWEKATIVPIRPDMLEGDWKKLEEGHTLAKRFSRNMPELYQAVSPGASLSFSFRGTTAAIFDLVGPDGGQLVAQFDNGKPTRPRRIDGYCTYHRMAKVNIATEKEDALHHVKITLTPQKLDKTKIIFESKRADIEKNPDKYAGHTWYPSAIMLIGELEPPKIPELPSDEHFKVETIAGGFIDAMELAVAPDGSVFVVERTGGVKLVDTFGKVETLAQLPVEIRKGEYAREAGLLGITLDPGYAKNHWLYLFYSVKGEKLQRLSRFTYARGKLAGEKVLLEFAHNRENAVCHEAGSIAFGPDGCLYLSTGDNTCPFQSSGYCPIDEREGRHFYDAQRSAANTNDLRGKVLRIRPKPDGTYDIPTGNLFAPGIPKTRPEIYAMGCRNPFRISVDTHTGFLYWGEVGPDAGGTSDRGSIGFDEVNQAKKAGYFGWPYFVADNKPYADFNFASNKVGEKFNPTTPVNDSPNNTGLQQLPPATAPLWFYPRASACAGPVYYAADFPDSSSKLPSILDGCLIVYDWTSAWVRVLKLNADGDIVWNQPWLGRHLFIHPVDMEFGPKGELYLLEYGTPWYDGKDGKLKKITFSATPVSLDVASADPRMKGLDAQHPGTELIGRTTCLACHTTQQKSIGPAYKDVAKKYAKDPEALERLAQKILTGGQGAWGSFPMPPHPQHDIEETRKMVEAILRIK